MPAARVPSAAQLSDGQAKFTGGRALDLSIHRGYTTCVSDLRFEWDPRKAAANKAKHGVTFDEAATVFSDELALFMDDPEHSNDEDRFVLMGVSSSVRLLVVVQAYRENDETVRIISARRANSRERSQYRESNSP